MRSNEPRISADHRIQFPFTSSTLSTERGNGIMEIRYIIYNGCNGGDGTAVTVGVIARVTSESRGRARADRSRNTVNVHV